MIIGIGNDIVDIRRIEKLLEKSSEQFIKRIFTESERKTCDARKKRSAAYAKRFAAKEACAKALGCGIGSKALFREIEISNDSHRAPYIKLSGSAAKYLQEIIPPKTKAKIFLSIADEENYATAQIVIEAL